MPRSKIALIAGFVAASVVCLCGAAYYHSQLGTNPFSRTLSFAYPSFSSSDAAGSRYIIDQSRRRVVACAPDGTIRAVIHGGSREPGTFFYANEVIADAEGRIYILNWVLDRSGFFMEREEILRYSSSGKFETVLYARRYEENQRVPSLVQRGQLSSLSIRGDHVRWFQTDERGINSWIMTVSSSNVESALAADLPRADLLVSGVARVDAETIVYITKKGKIIRQQRGVLPVVLYSADAQKSLSIPWSIGVNAQGDVFFSDLERGTISSIGPDGRINTVLSGESVAKQNAACASFAPYRLFISENGMISTCSDAFVITSDAKGSILFCSAEQNLSFRLIAKRFLAWFFLAAAGICLFFMVRIFYIHVLNKKIPDVLMKSVGIITVIGISAVIISSLIVQNFSDRYQKEALNKIAQMVQIIPKVIDSSRMEKITRQDDFLGADYMEIRENLLSSLNYNRDDWNNSYYFVLYRVIGERLYSFMYLNGESGLYYPVSYFDDPESVYRRAFSGTIATEKAEDEWGSWLDGVGPIRNKEGKVVALLEIGTDLYSFNQENNRLIKAIVLDVVTLLVIFVFAMIEFTFFMDMIKKRRLRIMLLNAGRTLRQSDVYSDVFLVRPVTFIVFTALTMSVVFIPLMMEKFYHPVAGLSKELVLGLPISCEMLFFAVASILAGRIVRRKGWRFMMRCGFAVTGVGLLLSGFSSGMISFLAARSVTGLGAGFFFMSMRSLIHLEKDSEIRSTAFAHFYSAMTVGLAIGAVVGGFAADAFGYATVFFVAFSILVIGVICSIIWFRNLMLMNPADAAHDDKNSLRQNAVMFFSDPRVIGFFLLILVPTYVASTYLAYYFPIFASANNVSSSDVGRLFILNGIFVIYMGPVLSGFFNKRFGVRRAMVAGSALWALALALAAFFGNIYGAVAALILMGITEGFCVNAQNDFFLSMKTSKKIGEDQAVGYYEMVGKLAETLGPILFGLALILGHFGGLSVIAAVVFILAVLYVRAVRKEQK
jgi:predicted MFS family arabinose efflux permease